VHVRFDGCIVKDLPQKRCDCVIFRFEPNASQPVMYAIETKKELKHALEHMFENTRNSS
jgi:hypothetical protein